MPQPQDPDIRVVRHRVDRPSRELEGLARHRPDFDSMNRGLVALLKFIEHSHRNSGISDDTYYEVKGEALKKLAHVKKFGRLDDYKRILDRYEEEGYDYDGEYDALGPEELVENFVERIDRPKANRKDQIARIAKERASLVEAKRNVEAMLEVLEEGFNEGSISQATYLELRKENGRKLDRIAQLINETQFTDPAPRERLDDEAAYGPAERAFETPRRAARDRSAPRAGIEEEYEERTPGPRKSRQGRYGPDEGGETAGRDGRYGDKRQDDYQTGKRRAGRLAGYELPSKQEVYSGEGDFNTGEYADGNQGDDEAEGDDGGQGPAGGPWVEGYHDDESAYGKQYQHPQAPTPLVDDSSMRDARDIISRLKLRPGGGERADAAYGPVDATYARAAGGSPDTAYGTAGSAGERDTAYSKNTSGRGFRADAMPMTAAEKAAMGDEKDKPQMPKPIEEAPAAASNPGDLMGRLRGAISQAAATVTHSQPGQATQTASAGTIASTSPMTGGEASPTASGGGSTAKLEIELEKLKTRVDALGEMREGLYERVSTIMENVGEIRSMVFSVDGAIKKQESTTEQFTDLVKGIEPQKYMKELEKRDSQNEQVALRVEKLEGMVQDLAHGVSAVRSLLESIGSLRNISEVNKDVAAKTGRMESMLGKAERLNEDVSTEFVELNRRLADFNTYRGRQDLLAESVKELVTMVESLNGKLNEFSTKEDTKTASHEIEDLKQSLKEFNAKIVLAQQGRDLPEPVKELRKKINAVKFVLAETEEEFLDRTISEADYKKIRETNFRKMRELEEEISRRLAQVTQAEEKEELKATSVGAGMARTVEQEAAELDEELAEAEPAAGAGEPAEVPAGKPARTGNAATAESVAAKISAAVRSKAPKPEVEERPAEPEAPMPEPQEVAPTQQQSQPVRTAATRVQPKAAMAEGPATAITPGMTDEQERQAVAAVSARLKVAQESVRAASPAPAAKVTSAISSMVSRVSTAIANARPHAGAMKRQDAGPAGGTTQVQPIVEGVPQENWAAVPTAQAATAMEKALAKTGAGGTQAAAEKAELRLASQSPAQAGEPAAQLAGQSRRRLYIEARHAHAADAGQAEPEVDLSAIPQPELDPHIHKLKNTGVDDIISGIMDELSPQEQKAAEAAARNAAKQQAGGQKAPTKTPAKQQADGQKAPTKPMAIGAAGPKALAADKIALPKASAGAKPAAGGEAAGAGEGEEVDVNALLDRLRSDLRKLKSSAEDVKAELHEHAAHRRQAAREIMHPPESAPANEKPAKPDKPTNTAKQKQAALAATPRPTGRPLFPKATRHATGRPLFPNAATVQAAPEAPAMQAPVGVKRPAIVPVLPKPAAKRPATAQPEAKPAAKRPATAQPEAKPAGGVKTRPAAKQAPVEFKPPATARAKNKPASAPTTLAKIAVQKPAKAAKGKTAAPKPKARR